LYTGGFAPLYIATCGAPPVPYMSAGAARWRGAVNATSAGSLAPEHKPDNDKEQKGATNGSRDDDVRLLGETR
jgi:hypothetical protein